MSDHWKPHGKVETLGYDTTLQYLRGPRKMGAHEVTFPDGQVLRVLPDSTSTARGRSAAIRKALSHTGAGIEACIGALILVGATHLELDGRDVIPAAGGKWLVLLDERGTVEARYVRGEER